MILVSEGRTVKTIQKYVDGIVDIDHPDEDVTVETTYGPDGQVLTLLAKNPATGDQLTRYVYGTTLADSPIARSDLLRAEIYPDSDDTTDPLGDGPDEVYDRIEHRYNRQGQRTETKDQNETVHAFDYDNLGRRIHDRVVTVGSGVDAAVRRISATYDVRGSIAGVATYDDPAAGSGNVLNELVFEYNDLGMPVREYQEHQGATDGNTLYVQYDYDTAASEGVFTHGLRPTSVRYPNGRRIHLDYGPGGGMADALGRVAEIRDDDGGSPGDTLAEYAYLGLGRIVLEDYVQPEVKLDYDSGTPGDYAGFDRFDRVVDHLWYAYAASADRDRYTYGYDRASNRLYRENTLTTGRDEWYGYDGVDRLIGFQRGELNPNKDGITGTPIKAEEWGLDTTGNWNAFLQKTSGTTDLNQTRDHNPVNEITEIAASVGTVWIDPVHDRAGNMTTIPKPANLADGLTATYDAWNRLVEVKDGQTVIARYEYDGLNRRIKSHIDSSAPSNPSGIDTYIHYYYNTAWQILETRQSDTPSAPPETLQPKHQYLWSQRYIDAPVLRDENTDTNGLCDDERLYYLNDANFNVTALVDTSGDAVERYLYSPYGVVTIYDATWTNTRNESNYANVTLYTGRELDGESGLYYDRNRYFSAQLGRFVSRDPIGDEGGISLSGYVGSSPTVRTDPSGLQAPISIGIGQPNRPPSPSPEKPSLPFPGFPDNDPDIIRSHTSLEFIITEILEPGNVCGDLQLRAVKRCNFTITWEETLPRGCTIPKALFNLRFPNEDVCAYLTAAAQQRRIENIPCPPGMACCKKKKYWGTHNVKVSADGLPIPLQPCKVTFELSANVGIVGELGVCSENAAAGGK